MKFLENIVDKINEAILKAFEFAKSRVPKHFYVWLDAVKKYPKQKFIEFKRKGRIFGLKAIGYPLFYVEKIKEFTTKTLPYIKEKEKRAEVLSQMKAFFSHGRNLAGLSIFILTAAVCGYFITKNVTTIIDGTKKLRAPASLSQEDMYVELNKIKFKALSGEDFYLNIKIFVYKEEQMIELDNKKEDLIQNISSLDFHIKELPLPRDADKHIAKQLIQLLGGETIKEITVTQHLPKRPTYFKQMDRQIHFFDISLQLFIEDTKRNKQVFLDFTVLSSNRTATQFFKDNEFKVRDHLNLNVEPIIPQLPLNDEGRQIIKDKIRQELQLLLINANIKADVVEIYIDYLLVS